MGLSFFEAFTGSSTVLALPRHGQCPPGGVTADARRPARARTAIG